MIKFEIPYNFDPDYVTKIKEYPELLNHVDCIYMPAWKNDCSNSRLNITFKDNYPADYDEYVKRINDIKTLGIPICILVQRGATLKLIERYIKLGISTFTLNDDALAKKIKTKYPSVKLTLSVTRALTLTDIVTTDLSMYDKIVLFFWFNRHLDSLARLPQNNKYTILANTGCYHACTWHDEHWFLKANSLSEYIEKERSICEKCRDKVLANVQNSALIEPEDLVWFDEYATTYKLTDRMDHTELIIDNLNAYVNRFRGCPRGRDYYNINS